MIPSWLAWLLLAVLTATARAEGPDPPGVPIQADVIFPLNNTVYNMSITPFPIIYKLTNSSAHWNHTGLTFTWRLYSLTIPHIESTGAFSHVPLDITHDVYDDGFFPARDWLYADLMWHDLATLYAHNPAGTPVEGDAFGLDLEFAITDACHRASRDNGYPIHSVFFNISGSGAMPVVGLRDANTCATPVAALVPSIDTHAPGCPASVNASEATVACAVRGGEELVHDAMVALANAMPSTRSNVTWPDGVLRYCGAIISGHFSSGGVRVGQAPWQVAVLGVIVGFGVYFV